MAFVQDGWFNFGGPGWVRDVLDVQIALSADYMVVDEENAAQFDDSKSVADIDVRHKRPIFTNEDIVKGVARITAPKNRSVWHDGIYAELESFCVGFEPARADELIRKRLTLAPSGYVSNSIELPFDFETVVGDKAGQLCESFEGYEFSIRHGVNVIVRRPWYTFDLIREIPFDVQLVYEVTEPESYWDVAIREVTKRELRDLPELQDVEGRETILANTEEDEDIVEIEEDVLISPAELHMHELKEAEEAAITTGEATTQGPIMTIPDCGGLCLFDFKKDTFPVDGRIQGLLRFKYIVHPILLVELRLVQQEFAADAEPVDRIIFSDYILDSRKYFNKDEGVSNIDSSSDSEDGSAPNNSVGHGKDEAEQKKWEIEKHAPVIGDGAINVDFDLSALALSPTFAKTLTSGRKLSQRKASRSKSIASDGETPTAAAAAALPEGKENVTDSPAVSVVSPARSAVSSFGGPEDLLGEADADEGALREDTTLETPSGADTRTLQSPASTVANSATPAHRSSYKRRVSTKYFLQIRVCTELPGTSLPESVRTKAFSNVLRAVAENKLRAEGNTEPTSTQVDEMMRSSAVHRQAQEATDRIPLGTFWNSHEITLYRSDVDGAFISENAARRVSTTSGNLVRSASGLTARSLGQLSVNTNAKSSRSRMMSRGYSVSSAISDEDGSGTMMDKPELRVRTSQTSVVSDDLPRPHSAATPSNFTTPRSSHGTPRHAGTPVAQNIQPSPQRTRTISEVHQGPPTSVNKATRSMTMSPIAKPSANPLSRVQSIRLHELSK